MLISSWTQPTVGQDKLECRWLAKGKCNLSAAFLSHPIPSTAASSVWPVLLSATDLLALWWSMRYDCYWLRDGDWGRYSWQGWWWWLWNCCWCCSVLPTWRTSLVSIATIHEKHEMKNTKRVQEGRQINGKRTQMSRLNNYWMRKSTNGMSFHQKPRNHYDYAGVICCK